jgi:hypothetical protein
MRNDKDYVGAIFLIFLGTIFLLNTTGVLSWNVWMYILNFWPVFLILGGLRLILGKSLASSIIISIIAVLAFGWIGVSAYMSNNDIGPKIFRNFPIIINNQIPGENVNQDFTVEQSKYQNAQNVSYDFNLGVSEFNITDGIEQYLYIDAEYTTQYGEPIISESISDTNLEIRMKEERARGFSFLDFKTPKYDIALGTLLSTDIHIDNGVGSGTVNLRNQNVKNLIVTTGTGEINITLGLDSIPTESLDLDVGTGRLTVNLPENVGYLITYSVGVGQINLGDREIGGIGQDGDEIKSDNYDEAERVVTINADVGVGQLDINFNN